MLLLIKSLLEQLVLVSDSPLEGSYCREEVSHRGTQVPF